MLTDAPLMKLTVSQGLVTKSKESHDYSHTDMHHREKEVVEWKRTVMVAL